MPNLSPEADAVAIATTTAELFDAGFDLRATVVVVVSNYQGEGAAGDPVFAMLAASLARYDAALIAWRKAMKAPAEKGADEGEA